MVQATCGPPVVDACTSRVDDSDLGIVGSEGLQDFQYEHDSFTYFPDGTPGFSSTEPSSLETLLSIEPMPFKCTTIGCGVVFKSDHDLLQHIRSVHQPGTIPSHIRFSCYAEGCTRVFRDKDKLYGHMAVCQKVAHQRSTESARQLEAEKRQNTLLKAALATVVTEFKILFPAFASAVRLNELGAVPTTGDIPAELVPSSQPPLRSLSPFTLLPPVPQTHPPLGPAPTLNHVANAPSSAPRGNVAMKRGRSTTGRVKVDTLEGKLLKFSRVLHKSTTSFKPHRQFAEAQARRLNAVTRLAKAAGTGLQANTVDDASSPVSNLFNSQPAAGFLPDLPTRDYPPSPSSSDDSSLSPCSSPLDSFDMCSDQLDASSTNKNLDDEDEDVLQLLLGCISDADAIVAGANSGEGGTATETLTEAEIVSLGTNTIATRTTQQAETGPPPKRKCAPSKLYKCSFCGVRHDKQNRCAAREAHVKAKRRREYLKTRAPLAAYRKLTRAVTQTIDAKLNHSSALSNGASAPAQPGRPYSRGGAAASWMDGGPAAAANAGPAPGVYEVPGSTLGLPQPRAIPSAASPYNMYCRPDPANTGAAGAGAVMSLPPGGGSSAFMPFMASGGGLMV